MNKISKSELRKLMKSTLKEYFSSNNVNEISAKICESVIESKDFENAQIILSFITGKLEIETSVINQKALKEKILAVPKVVSDTEIEFFVLDKNKEIDEQLDVGAFNIREPKAELKKLDFSTILEMKNILVLVPGIAFTKDGKRCGHGKGFYDRFLPKIIKTGAKVSLIGICLPCQIVEDLPCDEFDKKVDCVIF